MSLRLLLAAMLSLFGVVSYTQPAHATRRFPGVIESQLQLDYSPPCSVCHLTNKTGAATVTTPFAYALRARGLSGDRNSLPLALTQLTTDQTDSDGDGVSDITELKNGTDPNSKANTSLVDVADPSFGCSTSGPSRGAPAALALLLGAVAVHRFTRNDKRRARP